MKFHFFEKIYAIKAHCDPLELIFALFFVSMIVTYGLIILELYSAQKLSFHDLISSKVVKQVSHDNWKLSAILVQLFNY